MKGKNIRDFSQLGKSGDLICLLMKGNDPPMIIPKSIMIFAAHPDDELLSTGGTILKYSALGSKIKVVVATKGAGGYAKEKDKERILSYREKELINIEKYLDCEFINLNWPNIEIDRSSISHLTNLIRKHQPQVILIPHHKDTHRSHRNLSYVMREAIYHSTTGKAYGGHGKEFEPLAIYAYESPSYKFQYAQDMVYVTVDISTHWENKKTAFSEIYKSQVEVLNRALQWAEKTAKLRGNEIKGEYGEAFIPWTEYVPLKLLLR
jgi:LmbE family N-acetylglucosaminyl deacetylase